YVKPRLPARCRAPALPIDIDGLRCPSSLPEDRILRQPSPALAVATPSTMCLELRLGLIWAKRIQLLGIEPRTSAVLRPRHNQLDHSCSLDIRNF
ncbi:hypothetical protein THAOC_37480, partial [Thalassiosira oceanica]